MALAARREKINTLGGLCLAALQWPLSLPCGIQQLSLSFRLMVRERVRKVSQQTASNCCCEGVKRKKKKMKKHLEDILPTPPAAGDQMRGRAFHTCLNDKFITFSMA